jgi:hypothetical protein
MASKPPTWILRYDYLVVPVMVVPSTASDNSTSARSYRTAVLSGTSWRFTMNCNESLRIIVKSYEVVWLLVRVTIVAVPVNSNESPRWPMIVCETFETKTKLFLSNSGLHTKQPKHVFFALYYISRGSIRGNSFWKYASRSLGLAHNIQIPARCT